MAIPKSYKEWVQVILRYLEENNAQDDITNRLEVAKANSWGVRVKTVLDLISEKAG